MEVIDSEFSRQYQAKINGELAFVDYANKSAKYSLPKPYCPKRPMKSLSMSSSKGS